MTSVDNTFELQERIGLANDEAAYKQLFFLFFGSLRRFAMAILRSNEAAEEVVSDVFIKLWQRRSRIMAIENLGAYLYVSTKNTAFNYRAGRNNQQAFDLPDPGMAATSPNPEQAMITAEMMNQIQQVVHSLPPRCRMVFRLVKEYGLRYKEVAAVLDISIKTIDNQLAIALRRISQALFLKLDKPKARFRR